MAAQLGLAVLLVVAGSAPPDHPCGCTFPRIDHARRAALRSGVGGVTWTAFLTVVLGCGLVTAGYGVHTVGRGLVALPTVAGAVLLGPSLRGPTA